MTLKHIHSETTKKIKDNWFDKGKKEKNYFNKFIYFWISFNAFYCGISLNKNGKTENYKKFLCENEKRDGDKNRILFLVSIYIDIFKKNIENNKKLISFNDYIKTRKREASDIIGGVTNLVSGKIITYTEKENFQEFILIIYQVRNNLFHGGKDYGSPNDEELIKETNIVFEDFLETIYKS